MVSGPRDPKNRVRHQILRSLVVGELRGMSFSDLMQNCATNRLRQVLLAPTIGAEAPMTPGKEGVLGIGDVRREEEMGG